MIPADVLQNSSVDLFETSVAWNWFIVFLKKFGTVMLKINVEVKVKVKILRKILFCQKMGQEDAKRAKSGVFCMFEKLYHKFFLEIIYMAKF